MLLYIANSFLVTRLDSKRNITLACTHSYGNKNYTYLIIHTIITYRHFNTQSGDKDHSTHNEMAILMIYRFLQKYKG